MQTFTTPGERSVAPGTNAVSLLQMVATDTPETVSLAYRDGEAFVDVTAAEMWASVREIAAGLVAAGIKPGDRIALHSGTRIEFTLFDYAIWAAGAATTTIYETSSAEQIRWVISDSDSVAIVTENSDTAAVYQEVADDLPECTQMFVISDGAVDSLKAMATDESRAETNRRIAAIAHGDLATLVYTSGTTGMPKGCVLTHYNFAWEVTQLDDSVADLMGPGNSTLMFLPLAHIFARAVQSACVSQGVTIGYSTGIPNLVEELSMFKPTWIFSVPRVFEKIYNGAKQKADADGKGKIFDKAAATAISYSQGIQRGKIGIGTKASHALFDKLVYGKLRAAMGGELKYAISGGAALGSRLGHFFRGIGVIPLEGYGLTETTAGATINRPDAIRIGTVGRPLQGASIRIAEDGEVLIKGGHVFSGYWKNDAATAEILTDDGWFHSGDIGALDEDGFLAITGRKKELIVTASGKNVAPGMLEDRMRSSAIISQVMVVGDARPFVAALVTLDDDSLPVWAAANGLGDVPVDELREHDSVRAEVDEAVAYANKMVSKPESVREYRILPKDFTIEGGELTPTLKVKRSVVASHNAAYIDDMYN
jgi:long-chain acyl-CoA synthetase